MAVFVTKSPLTGTITDSHHGGWSAARLRWAGYDGLVFKGKAPKPTYAYIHDGQFELLDASEVWGRSVHETVRFFKEKYGEKDLTVITIGPAGENLVKFANWINEDDRASGRGGTGCVGGSKNLKAIVIKAEKKMVKASDREKWKEAHKKALAEIMDERVVTSPRKGGLSVYGKNVASHVLRQLRKRQGELLGAHLLRALPEQPPAQLVDLLPQQLVLSHGLRELLGESGDDALSRNDGGVCAFEAVR